MSFIIIPPKDHMVEKTLQGVHKEGKKARNESKSQAMRESQTSVVTSKAFTMIYPYIDYMHSRVKLMP